METAARGDSVFALILDDDRNGPDRTSCTTATTRTHNHHHAAFNMPRQISRTRNNHAVLSQTRPVTRPRLPQIDNLIRKPAGCINRLPLPGAKILKILAPHLALCIKTTASCLLDPSILPLLRLFKHLLKTIMVAITRAAAKRAASSAARITLAAAALRPIVIEPNAGLQGSYLSTSAILS
jgi:hypothetical protein